MKKLMFSLFAAMMLIGVQAMAQDATNEKPIWQPSVDLSLSYSSRYISDGWVINPESMIFGDINLTWDFNEFGGIYIGTWFANDWNDYNEGAHVPGDGLGGVVGEPEEIDYYFGYGHTFEELDVIQNSAVLQGEQGRGDMVELVDLLAKVRHHGAQALVTPQGDEGLYVVELGGELHGIRAEGQVQQVLPPEGRVELQFLIYESQRRLLPEGVLE